MAVAIEDRCCWKRCRAESAVIYRGEVGLCMRCWAKACDLSRGGCWKTIRDNVIPKARRALREKVEA